MNYNSLLFSKTSDKWKAIGIGKRAGVALPLFSIYSKNSIGIGEIPDLRFIIDWCARTDMSIIQLLPLNEVGFDFAPYNSISTFALEPMYLSIRKLRKVNLEIFKKEMRILKKNFPKNSGKVNYEIKTEKLNLLRKIFSTVDYTKIDIFQKFINKNIHWLKYYSLFKILTRLNGNMIWEKWELKHKYISSLTAEKILQTYPDEVIFYYWLQWQLYEQLITIKRYARQKNIFIMGDLPFLVSRNSAEVWAYKNYFKMELSSGAPPDMYFAKGQRWGMPPYDWDNIAADNFGYIRQRLKYAENFFDMFRIDHFVGLFRVWTINADTPEEMGGLAGRFDPESEYLWEEHGRNILTVINDSTKMLPCAEDLGTVPKCSEKILKEFGIAGINVQRWEKKWNGQYYFIPAEEYRINSAATLSTHDSSTFPAWWKYEAGTIDAISFEQFCNKNNITENNFVMLKNILFDKNLSHEGRLMWRRNIFNVYVLLDILKLSFNEAKELVEMYLSSYDEKKKFWVYVGMKAEYENEPSVNLIKKTHEKISSANSIFSIQLINEYLYLDKNILKNFSGMDYRINFPGTVNENNWRIRLPVSLEELKELEINDQIKEINLKR